MKKTPLIIAIASSPSAFHADETLIQDTDVGEFSGNAYLGYAAGEKYMQSNT